MADDGPLLPRIGALPDAHAAIDLVLMSDGAGVTDLDRYSELDEDSLVGVVASLANLAALLARMVSGYQNQAAGQPVTSAARLLESVRVAQEVREARDELGSLDFGSPFDA